MPRKYKVLHVIDHLGTGGAQEVVMNLIKYRDAARFDCEVACLHGRGAYFDKCRELGYRVYSLSPSKYLPVFLWNLWRLHRAHHYDIMHFHLQAANILAKPLAALCGVPVRINHDHQNDPARYKNRVMLLADRLANRYSSYIIPVSQSTADFLLKWEKLDPAILTTIINGVDTERFHPQPERRTECLKRWNLPDDKLIVAGVGRLRHQKNFFLFLNVAAEVLRQTQAIHFVLAGDGPDETELKNHAIELGITEHVTFLGFVGDVTTLYPAVDISMLTSRYEGTPLTILEAMACQLPIVASAVDGTAEILEPDKHAILCRPDRPDDFVNGLLLLASNEENRRALSLAAYELVKKQYSAEMMTKQVEVIYLKYLNEKSRKDSHADSTD